MEMEEVRRWAVLGGSGFVGRSVRAALTEQQEDVRVVRAPRLDLPVAAGVSDVIAAARNHDEVRALSAQFENCTVVVNAAGLATPGSGASTTLTGANALLPVVAFEATRAAGARRFIHISSAAVQGRRRVLDETSDTAPLSPYAASKALGEAALRRAAVDVATCELVILRATSVQGRERQTTASLRRLARSPLASVAAPGTQPTIVSSSQGLGAFVVTLGVQPSGATPLLALQPWEGISVSEILHAAGGRSPRVLPHQLCHSVVSLAYTLARVSPGLAGTVRRIELMWFGQAQNAEWAIQRGLDPAPPLVLKELMPADTLAPPSAGESVP
ncbi:NAD-dependent epimerase/dehydratase family protein [Actinotalea ferrariae]|uniref:NAD-dependent epimerase/dehydratase family protein n=1 Tax=Actinotalea ferrariae TaxID=1386098 RepID=UPI0009E09568|nr:NAD-dependent epimerase/dehydratase family protein [Actinotalea ferrariae]